MECKQDKKKVRETSEDLDEPNWKHKDKIAEAEGLIIKPNREWTPGYTPEPESNSEKKDKEQLNSAEQVDNKDEIKYDAFDAFDAFKEARRKGHGSNPVNIVKTVRTIKEKKKTGKENC